MAIILFACQPAGRDAAKEKETLLEIDRNFSKLSADRGMVYAFTTYSADDVVKFRDGAFPIVGKQELIRSFQGVNDSIMLLTWEPVNADISSSGDLGYTYGNWKMHFSKPDTTLYGVYVTVWKKQVDGTWKVVLDGGNDTPSPSAETP